MHDVETIFHLSYVLKNLEMFSEIRVMPVKCNLEFNGHQSYFRKGFQMLLTLKEGHT